MIGPSERTEFVGVQRDTVNVLQSFFRIRTLELADITGDEEREVQCRESSAWVGQDWSETDSVGT
jgi:hypothetical protein